MSKKSEKFKDTTVYQDDKWIYCVYYIWNGTKQNVYEGQHMDHSFLFKCMWKLVEELYEQYQINFQVHQTINFPRSNSLAEKERG